MYDCMYNLSNSNVEVRILVYQFLFELFLRHSMHRRTDLHNVARPLPRSM